MVRKAKLAKKEIEMAIVSKSCGSSFRSISPVGIPDDDLTKDSEWMDKTETAQNGVESISALSGQPKPKKSEKSQNEGTFSAGERESKPSENSSNPTEAVEKDDRNDRTRVDT